MRQALQFIFRGKRVDLAAFPPTRTLLDWLREDQRATGTKEGCNEGDCGACTVVLARAVDGRIRYQPVNACILLLGQVDGAEIITVEDLAIGGELHPVQAAMVKHHGSQCGFCTPGIVMSLFADYHSAQRPVTRAGIEDCLSGNLCRCTGYRPIVDAALEALANPPGDAFAAASAERLHRLEALADNADLRVGNGLQFFAAPASLDRFAELVAGHPDATILAGATDVGLWVTKRLMDLQKVIWLGRVAGFDRIVEDDNGVTIGAGTSLAEVTVSLGAIDPDLVTLMRRFGSWQVRASGTIGGNIANGSPIGDLAPALIALDAGLRLRRGGLTRRMPLEAFFIEYGRQNRDPGEFIAAITVPKLRPHQRLRAFKISKRFDEDISTVMGAFRFDVIEGRIHGARIAYGGMAGTPKRASATEAALEGLSLDDSAAWAAAIAQLEADFAPISDMRASAGYRMRVARAILEKAILEIAGAPGLTRILPRGGDIHAA